ncbi:MAG: hypothetical protein JNK24_00770 [Alphaproteobacteria bacterium]|nr:hypothetical protein [Alphaproteobacteria bacterium]
MSDFCKPIPPDLERFRDDMGKVAKDGVIIRRDGYQIRQVPPNIEPGAVNVDKVGPKSVDNVGCFKP